MKSKVAVVLVLAITLLAAYFVTPPRVRWDGVFYYITLRSIYFDGDIDFRNEADEYEWVRMLYGVPLENDLLANPFPVGSALLWSPFFVVADHVCQWDVTCERTGYSTPYLRAVVMATAFWVAIGLLLNIAALRRLYGNLPLSINTVVVLLVTSPLIFYMTEEADYSHGNAYFANALLLWLTLWSFDARRLNLVRSFLCGLALGLVFLIRWQDVLVGLLPVALILSSARAARLHIWLRDRSLQLCALGSGAVVAALPQLAFWQILYGSFLTIPQGEGFLSFNHVELVRFLFSTWNGAFLFHPILFVALLGFIIAFGSFKKARSQSDVIHDGWIRFPTLNQFWSFLAALLLVIALQFMLSMMVKDWWSGGSFGQRRLVSVLPLLSVGLYYVLHRGYSTRRPLRWWATSGLLGALILLNGLTFYRYYEGKIPFNPEDKWWYASDVLYDHFDYARRFQDLLLGRFP